MEGGGDDGGWVFGYRAIGGCIPFDPLRLCLYRYSAPEDPSREASDR